MNVKDFISMLQGVPGDGEVLIASDEEGNVLYNNVEVADMTDIHNKVTLNDRRIYVIFPKGGDVSEQIKYERDR